MFLCCIKYYLFIFLFSILLQQIAKYYVFLVLEAKLTATLMRLNMSTISLRYMNY